MLTEESDLISLLAGRQRQIRHICQEIWNGQYDIYISDSEWAVLRLSATEAMTVSVLAKHLGITRQATHKIVKSMEVKALVKVYEVEEHRNRKYVVVTEKGETYEKEYQNLKEKLVGNIEHTIGAENTENLKRILSIDWGMVP